MLARAVQNSALVITEWPRAAYWRGEKIEIAWDKFPARWTYFLTLCRAAKHGQIIDDTLFAEDVAAGYAAKTKSKLAGTEGFPAQLGQLMVSAGRGSQKLDLVPEQIRLFETESIDRLREKG